MAISRIITAGLFVAFFMGCSRREPTEEVGAEAQVGAERGKAVIALAELSPTQGNQAKGRLTLMQEKDGVRIRGAIEGLGSGTKHGFHVHEKGDCAAPDAKSAGEHLNPTHQHHGKAQAGPHHLGDMDNLTANEHGVAAVDVLLRGAMLADGSPSDLIGKAFIVHAAADDYKSQPAGDSGPRIACGVIVKK